MAKIEVDRRLEVAELLQELLVDVMDLALQSKQAHWNLRGPMFRELHLLLDELADRAQKSADDIAERCLALGVAADGRPATIVKNTDLDPFPEGRIEDDQAVALMISGLTEISERGRSRLVLLGDQDLVSQDLVIEILRGLEKMRWLFEAHRPAHKH
jgi:starvation-inducible DNA-binding protein